MKYIHIDIADVVGLSQSVINQQIKKLKPYIKEIHRDIAINTETAYAFASVIDNHTMLKQVKQLADEKKKFRPAMIFVVGIGGSNLGTMAVQQVLLGCLYNDLNPTVQIYYVDTVDADYLHSLLSIAECALKDGKQILVNVISKSGKTTETIANFQLFLQLLKNCRPQAYADYIVATTDKNSQLWQLATQAHWATLEVPAQLGGRYSVFSPVGLFPLCMIDIDVDQLLEGARHMRDLCLQMQENPAAKTATWQYLLLQSGYDISNLFLFSNELQSCGKWWRQLMGESLGKAQSVDGQKNAQMLVPTVSVGSTDLHSVGQLYLANVVKIVTQFVVVEQNHFEIILPDYAQYFDPLVKDIQNRSLAEIMHAIVSGVQRAYTKKGLPFCTITFPEKNAYYVGQFLQYKMFEIYYIAKLLDINPFDQPEVEAYKSEIREILKKDE